MTPIDFIELAISNSYNYGFKLVTITAARAIEPGIEPGTNGHLSSEAGGSARETPEAPCGEPPPSAVTREAEADVDQRPPATAVDEEVISEEVMSENEDAAAEVEPGTREPEDQDTVPCPAGSPVADDAAATRRGVEGGRHDSPLDRARASDNPILGIPLEEYSTVVEQLADELVNRRSGGVIDERLSGGCAEGARQRAPLPDLGAICEWSSIRGLSR